MDPRAVEQSRTRYAKAERAVSVLATDAQLAVIESAWAEFLANAFGIYVKLEQGAKITPQSRQWFGSKKAERKRDPLLTYVHQDRNAEQHGLEPVTARKLRNVTLRKQGEHAAFVWDGRQWVADLAASNFNAEPIVVLTRVYDDRFKQGFEVPSEHLGVPLPDQSPLTVARAALVYLEAMLSEAAALV